MYESGMVSASTELRMGAALSWMVPTLKEAALATAATERVRADFMMTKRAKLEMYVVLVYLRLKDKDKWIK